jgi:uncharacterized membrane protein
MTKPFGFLKTAILGGVFVILPVLLVYLAIDTLFDFIDTLAEPMRNMLPAEWTEHSVLRSLVSVGLLIGISFLFGLAALSSVGRRAGQWIEGVLLSRLPLYGTLKSLTRSFNPSEADADMRIGVMQAGDGIYAIVYIIEDFGGEHVTVLMASAPGGMAGPMRVVRRDKVEPLDAKFLSAYSVFTEWGSGAQDLLKDFFENKAKQDQ